MSRSGIRTSDNESGVLDSMTADRSIGFEIVIIIINRHFAGIRNLPAAIAICLRSNNLGNICHLLIVHAVLISSGRAWFLTSTS